MTDPELMRTAVHEASHTAMARILNVPAGYISLDPGPGYLGVTRHGQIALPKLRDGDLDGPVISMRPALRRGLEKQIMISLAGRLGETHLLPVEPGFSASLDDGDEHALRLAELASLDRREAASLATLELHGVEQSDMERARRRAWALAGSNLAEKYVMLLEAVATEIVLFDDRFRKIVDGIVPPAVKHRRLSARAVRAILEKVDPKEVTA